jgi:ABC-2 type transport system ATP-binding protein
MIEFQAVTRTYGQKVAVAGLDLVVPRGELFAFLGPNGAGKTTSIKMLVGLLRPTSGRVRVCGFDVVTETREANRRLGFVPDEPYLYDKLSGREFLEFITSMYGLAPQAGRERIEREIENFRLADFVDDLTESYSHGMKQRLVFAAALLHDPQVLVLDEPMVGLDPRSARMVKDLLQERSKQGMTIFMSTHTLGLAEEIADRIGIVDHGQLRCVGTLDELKRELAFEGTSLEQLFLEVTGTAER